MTLGLVWAQSKAGVIGSDGRLPWRLPEDLAHFKAVTLGHPVIMGRRTWESLPERFRPLPGRRNIVVSRRSDLRLNGADVAASLGEALELVGGPGASIEPGREVWIIGGAQVFAAAMPLAAVAEVTEIEIDVAGDTYAPSLAGWTVMANTDWRRSTVGLWYRFLRYRSPAG